MSETKKKGLLSGISSTTENTAAGLASIVAILSIVAALQKEGIILTGKANEVFNGDKLEEIEKLKEQEKESAQELKKSRELLSEAQHNLETNTAQASEKEKAHKQTTSRLEKEIENLTKRQDSKARELEASRKDHEGQRTRAEIAATKLRQQVDSLERKERSVRQKFEDQTALYARVIDERDEKVSEIKKLMATARGHAGEKGKLFGELQTSQSQVQELQRTIANALEEKGDAITATEELKLTNTQLSTKKAEQMRMAAELEVKVTAAEVQIQSKDAEYRENIAELEGKLAVATRQSQTKDAEHKESIRKLKAGLKEKRVQEKQGKLKLLGEKAALQAQLEGLQSAIDEITAEKELVRSEYTEITKLHEADGKQLKDQQAQLEKMQDELKAVEETNADLISQQAGDVLLQSNFEETIRGKQSEIDALTLAAGKAAGLREILSGDLVDAEERLQTAVDGVDEKERTLTSQRQAFTQQLEQQKSELQSLRQAKQAVEEAKANTERANANMELQRGRDGKEIDDLKRKDRAAQESLKANKDAYSAALDELVALKAATSEERLEQMDYIRKAFLALADDKDRPGRSEAEQFAEVSADVERIKVMRTELEKVVPDYVWKESLLRQAFINKSGNRNRSKEEKIADAQKNAAQMSKLMDDMAEIMGRGAMESELEKGIESSARFDHVRAGRWKKKRRATDGSVRKGGGQFLFGKGERPKALRVTRKGK